MARVGESSANLNSRTLNIVILTRAVWIDNMLHAPALTSDVQLTISDWMVVSPQTHKLSFLTMPHSPYPLTGRLAMHTMHFILDESMEYGARWLWDQALDRGNTSVWPLYLWVQVESNQLKLNKFSKLVFFSRILPNIINSYLRSGSKLSLQFPDINFAVHNGTQSQFISSWRSFLSSCMCT